jgi:hypothetical protein
MNRKIKWTYDPERNETIVRLGKKGLRFEGEPNPVFLRDAEYLLTQAKP